MNEKVDHMSIKYFEKQQECIQYQKKYEALNATYEEEKRLLNEEIDDLKQRES